MAAAPGPSLRILGLLRVYTMLDRLLLFGV
jgi:hypothetical protein